MFKSISELSERDRTELLEFLEKEGITHDPDCLEFVRSGIFFDIWVRGHNTLDNIGVLLHPRKGWGHAKDLRTEL